MIKINHKLKSRGLHQNFMTSFTTSGFYFNWFICYSIFGSLVLPMRNRKSCAQIDELQKSHCDDNSKDR